MRWFDEYIGLLAAALAFGAVVLWASGAPAYAGVSTLGMALAVAAITGFRAIRAPRVVLVGEPPGAPLYRLREELDDAGFGLRSCPGPNGRPCPVVDGKPCPIPGHPVAAVIVRRGGQVGSLPPCGRGLGVPVVTFREENRDPAVTVLAVRGVTEEPPS